MATKPRPRRSRTSRPRSALPPETSDAVSDRRGLPSLAYGLAYSVGVAANFGTPSPLALFFALAIPATVCLAALDARRPLRAALLFGLGAWPGYFFVHAWLIDVTAIGWPLLALYMALYPALAVWIGARLRTRLASPVALALCAAIVYAALVFARSRFVLGGYPWHVASQGLIDIPGAAALASVYGMLGLNTVVCVAGAFAALGVTLLRDSVRGAGAHRLTRRDGVFAIAGAGKIIVLLALGLLARAVDPAGPPVRIAVAQSNVPQSNKSNWTEDRRIEDFNALALMTIAAARSGEPPHTIVWPETMFPGSALNPDAVEVLRASRTGYALTGDLADALRSLQSQLGVPMLVGAMTLLDARIVPAGEGFVRAEAGARYNSVFVIDGGEVADERYDKLQLTPFGEVMPLISRSDWLERQLLAIGAPGMSFDLAAGEKPVTLELPLLHREDAAPSDNGSRTLRVATPICFESTMPSVCRRLVFDRGERAAGVMVVVTNDGWFGDSDATRETHLLLARWRAAELATPIVRAANTGVSASIDAKGRVLARGVRFVDGATDPAATEAELANGSRVAGVHLAEVAPGAGRTLYARLGEWLGWLTFLAGAAFTIAALVPNPRKPRNPRTPQKDHA